MKSVKTALVAAVISIPCFLSFSSNAINYTFVAGNDSFATKICLSVVKNRIIHYHKMLKGYRVSKKVAANKLRCNQLQLADFAIKYNAHKVAKAINRHKDSRIISVTPEIQDKNDADVGEKTVVIVVN